MAHQKRSLVLFSVTPSLYHHSTSPLSSLPINLILTNVDFWRLHQIKLLVGGLLHQIEHCVLEHVFEHVGEEFVGEVLLTIQIIIIIPRKLLEIVFVHRQLAAQLSKGWLGQVLVDVVGRGRLVVTRHHLIEDATATALEAVVQQAVHFSRIQYVIRHLVYNILVQGLIFARFYRIVFLLL